MNEIHSFNWMNVFQQINLSGSPQREELEDARSTDFPENYVQRNRRN